MGGLMESSTAAHSGKFVRDPGKNIAQNDLSAAVVAGFTRLI
jgi:hypothetical protein